MACLARLARLTRLTSTGPTQTFRRAVCTVNAFKLGETPSFLPKASSVASHLAWNVPRNSIIRLPVVNVVPVLDLPVSRIPPLGEKPPSGIIEAPGGSKANVDIQAARLIKIRRKKMKKHKLRKLRKKMKFEWAKLRQRREMRKEKAFHALLINMCKKGETFSAEQFVEERLAKHKEITAAAAEHKTETIVVTK